MKVGKKTFKVHLDGYDITDALAGKSPSPRHEFFYFNDDGSLVGLRYDQWKVVFAEQRSHGMDVWQDPFVPLRLPKLFNLRSDPFETADHEGMDYERWRVEHVFVLVPAQEYVGKFLSTFKEFLPSQKPVVSRSTQSWKRCSLVDRATDGTGNRGSRAIWSRMADSTGSGMFTPNFRITGIAIVMVLALVPPQQAVTAETGTWTSLRLASHEIAPGTSSRFALIPDRSFEASYLNSPVFVARGASPGPTLCLTAGVHGDELNGVEVARRSFAETDPKALKGTLIALPAINAEGVRTGNRYMSDRRDLNRAFPGTKGGSVASLISHAIFSELVEHCEALIDLHTASNNRSNLPQIRADLDDPAILKLRHTSDSASSSAARDPTAACAASSPRPVFLRSSTKPVNRCVSRRKRSRTASPASGTS